MDALRQSMMRAQLAKPLPNATQTHGMQPARTQKTADARVSEMAAIAARCTALDKKLDTLIEMLIGPAGDRAPSHRLLPADVRRVVTTFFDVTEQDLDQPRSLRRHRAHPADRLLPLPDAHRAFASGDRAGFPSRSHHHPARRAEDRRARARPTPRSTTICRSSKRDWPTCCSRAGQRDRTDNRDLNMAKKKKSARRERRAGNSRAPDAKREFPPTQVKRLRDAAMAGLRDPEWGTELGRLYLDGTITATMYAAGKNWREKAAQYVNTLGHFPVRTILVEGRGGSLPPDPDTEEGQKRARREADAMERFFEAHHVSALRRQVGGSDCAPAVREQRRAMRDGGADRAAQRLVGAGLALAEHSCEAPLSPYEDRLR